MKMDGTFASGLKTWLGTKNNRFARDMLTGLSVSCPLGQNHQHCPLSDIRPLPHAKRVAWLNAKSDQEIEQLYARHYSCLKEREQACP